MKTRNVKLETLKEILISFWQMNFAQRLSKSTSWRPRRNITERNEDEQVKLKARLGSVLAGESR